MRDASLKARSAPAMSLRAIDSRIAASSSATWLLRLASFCCAACISWRSAAISGASGFSFSASASSFSAAA